MFKVSKNDVKNYLLVFLPLIWIPVLLWNPWFFIKYGRANENTLYALYCNYSSQIVIAVIALGNIFSFYRLYVIKEKIKYFLLAVILLSIPVQYISYLSANLSVFGK